ncbi:MAG: UDP-3-O-acyl-N-acetylglucosamine deacetylase [Candidatus Margulisbacteria bacterium]|nr:UDP-3-O-acyl-N-acetylglucosamine deacetylase [Candidatus Margulisiibacteriota bacterium]
MKQKTISQPFSLSGIGIHSGEESIITLSPALPGSGITFFKDGRKIPALVDQVKETRRGTSLDGIAVTEHLLSATYGLGIDNLEIKVIGGEIPIMDGSALPFVTALEKAGIVEQEADKNALVIDHPVRIIEEKASLELLPCHGFKVDFMVDFPVIGEERCCFDSRTGDFKQEIAPARTFGYIDEYELLKEQGLAKGASLNNALVLGKDGYVNAPRFPDEPVRHKILDLIGDLILLGRPLQAEVRAVRSGHRLNIELIRRLSGK